MPKKKSSSIIPNVSKLRIDEQNEKVRVIKNSFCGITSITAAATGDPEFSLGKTKDDPLPSIAAAVCIC